jgi:hypothetical protein
MDCTHRLVTQFLFKASNVQNEEWVNFQSSISVQGFNTGQSTAISSASRGVKSRGGSGMRRRREKEMEMIAAESVTASSNVSLHTLEFTMSRLFFTMERFHSNIFPHHNNNCRLELDNSPLYDIQMRKHNVFLPRPMPICLKEQVNEGHAI